MEKAQQPKSKYRIAFAVLLTLALYLSGLFVLLTPLPLLFHLVSEKEDFLKKLVAPVLGVLLFLYLFALMRVYLWDS